MTKEQRQHSGPKIIFSTSSTWIAGYLHGKKNECRLKCKSQKHKTPRRKPRWPWYGSDFLDMTPKGWSMKGIIDKLELTKIKNFCSVKCTVKRVKDMPQAEESLENT